MGTTQWDEARIRADDEVILPAFGGLEAAKKVCSLGAVPVPVDIDPVTFCLDPYAVRVAVTGRTAAVVVDGLFGHPVDLVRLRALTGPRAIRFVSDDAARDLPRGNGRENGTASPETAARRRHAAYLDARLTGVIVPAAAAGAWHTYREYVVRVPGNGRPDRDAYRHALLSRGVRCHVPVRTPVHRTPGFRSAVRLPEAERAADECLALPVEASLTKRELRRVVSACNSLGGLLEPAC